MRIATNLEHRDFFSKNHFIEFEKLISAEDCAFLLAKTPERDLWRKNPQIKKITLSSKFAEIAASLAKKNSLRLAYDERLPAHFQAPHPLGETTCLKHLSISLLLILSGEKAGNGIFFLPDVYVPSADDAFLITYCEPRTMYLLDKSDPHVHDLKKLGYVFGDLLRSETHPILYP